MRLQSLKTCITVLLILGATSFMWWRCQFGVELYDEPLYLTGAFKLFALGDSPFKDELHNGLRQYDILSYLFVRPFAGESVLSIRRSSILVFAVLLLALCLIGSQKKDWPFIALLFSALLIYDAYQFPTWSHNTWCRNAVLAHHFLLLLAFKKPTFQKYLLALAGFSLSIATIAYNPILLVTWFAPLLIWILSPDSSKRTRNTLFYSIGFVFPLVVDCSYILSSDVRPYWLQAVATMVTDYSSAHKISVSKPLTVLFYILKCRELWIFLVSFYALHRWKKEPNSKVHLATILICCAYILKRAHSYDQLFIVHSTMIGLGFACGIFAILQKQSRPLIIMAISTLAIAFVMAISSHNSTHTLFWVLPSLIAPACGYFLKEIPRSRLPILFVSAFLLIGSLFHQLTETAYDVSIFKSDTMIEVAPLQGIFTSKKRKELIHQIAKRVGDEEYILSIGLPGVFYFGNARSATDSTTINTNFPRSLGLQALRHMKEESRVPKLAIVENTNSWSWGNLKQPINAHMESHIDNLYYQFIHCSGTVESKYREYSVYRISQTKAESCLSTLLFEEPKKHTLTNKGKTPGIRS